MNYHFKTHKEKNGYWAECIELKGCQTQADSFEKLRTNMEKILNLFLEEPEHSKATFPFPKKSVKGSNIVSVPVNPRVAFAFYLRSLRLKYRLTQRQAAKRLGMNRIYSYQRLESSKTANPELNTLAKLKAVFPEFNLQLVF